jgi:hypothetical protein
MSYSNFTLDDLEEKYSIVNKNATLFTEIEPIEPTNWLKETLSMSKMTLLKSTKAKTEAVLFPILMELKQQTGNYFLIHSGETLNIDGKRGLSGEFDFLLSKNSTMYSLNLPIVSVVAPKKGDMELGIGQCAAQMVGANFFNIKRKNLVPIIYGCVTDAYCWKFLRLENNMIFVDRETYYFSDLPKILGVFNQIFNYYKATIG